MITREWAEFAQVRFQASEDGLSWVELTERADGDVGGGRDVEAAGLTPAANESSGRELETSRRQECRVREALREFRERRDAGLVPDSPRFALTDPAIPEELCFEVWLHDAARRCFAPRRMPPFDVFLCRNAAGRRAWRNSGGKVPTPAERRAWENWAKCRGPRPDDGRQGVGE